MNRAWEAVRHNVTRWDISDSEAACRLAARAARALMYAVAGVWFLGTLVVSLKGTPEGAGQMIAAFAKAIVVSAFDAAPAWILFGFVWFFAEWFANVAAKKIRSRDAG
jgi:hypothetical protein